METLEIKVYMLTQYRTLAQNWITHAFKKWKKNQLNSITALNIQ